MTKVFLSLHVLAAIVAIGPVTVAASMFPPALRRADLPTVRTLHRICRVYAVLGLAVPVFGLATASSLGVLGDAWLLTSIVLTAAAAAILGLTILPGQAAALTRLTTPTGTEYRPTAPARPATPAGAGEQAAAPVIASDRGSAKRLGMVTGVFNLLWAVVVVLMIVRPGSTTGG